MSTYKGTNGTVIITNGKVTETGGDFEVTFDHDCPATTANSEVMVDWWIGVGMVLMNSVWAWNHGIIGMLWSDIKVAALWVAVCVAFYALGWVWDKYIAKK